MTPVFHLVHARDSVGWYRTGCVCPIGVEHALGARGKVGGGDHSEYDE